MRSNDQQRPSLVETHFCLFFVEQKTTSEKERVRAAEFIILKQNIERTECTFSVRAPCPRF